MSSIKNAALENNIMNFHCSNTLKFNLELPENAFACTKYSKTNGLFFNPNLISTNFHAKTHNIKSSNTAIPLFEDNILTT